MLQPAERPGLLNSNQVADFALVFSVLRIELLRAFQDLPELGMRNSAPTGNDYGLIHFIGDHLPDSGFPKMPLRNIRLLRLGFRRRGSTFSCYSLFTHV